jgi:PAS domain S-box-containing protein
MHVQVMASENRAPAANLDRLDRNDEAEMLRAALAAVEVGVWVWDVREDSMKWSPELCALFGRAADGPPPTYEKYLTLIPEPERAPLVATIDAAVAAATASGKPQSYLVEHRVILPGGEERWIEGRGRVVIGADGRPNQVTGTAVDITSRKRSEQAQRRIEEVLRIFTELASDYVYVAEYGNPNIFPEIVAGSFERTVGLTPVEVQARGGWWQVIHPDDRAALGGITATLEAGRPSVIEYRIIDGRGQIRWLRDSIRPVLDPATGRVARLMGGVQDITERKRLEEQLLQAQKLEAVARLSGSIAHDFNNLLSVVMGSLAALDVEVKSVEGRQSCEAILEAAKRGAELVRSLLMFARRDYGTPKVVDLRTVVRAAQPLLTRAVGRSVTISLDVDGAGGAPVHVRIDPGQAQLLLLNLATNARDAMPSGGEIRFAVRCRAADDQGARPAELPAGRYALLTVSDQGSGIAPEAMGRIFEPFFTTKPLGKGTGLGLAACHGIVRHAGGAIEVKSALGVGTTFTIHLPLVDEGAPAASPVRSSVGGSERVLLVEDEPALQRLMLRSLREHGYATLAADSAEAALELLAREPVALLISDVGLPGASGSELAARVRESWPQTRILLVSGNAGAAELPEEVPFLPKPFTMDRLLQSVRDVLGGAAGPR